MEELLNPYLKVRPSTLPGVGRGLFTKIFIPKGTLITEHTGKITSLKEADHSNGNNVYLFFVSMKHVIDAKSDTKILARYVNDAKGITRVSGLKNNAGYVVMEKRVFIVALRNIEANEEIFVGYGKQYWDVVRKNFSL